MKTNIRKRLLLTLSVTTVVGTNNVLAFSGAPGDIDQACAGLGYSLVRVDEAHNCSTCHGSSQAKSAYLSGNWEYFCPAPAPEPICTDADNDGFFVEGSNCGTQADFNDNDARAYPGAVEDCTDGIDNDGDGLIDTNDSDAVGCPVSCTDSDNDGFFVEGSVCGTTADFNDNDARAYPGAIEDCTDGIDNDGDGLVDTNDSGAVGCPVNCTDMDGDGASPDGGSCGPIDCDDSDAAIHPAADEICTDSIDNNCNGNVDTADVNAVGCPLTCTDNDGDGVSVEGGACGPIDCNDDNPAINPSALEICDDGIDNNCDNRSDTTDSVCQSNEVADNEEDHKPWWRNRDKRDRDNRKRNKDDRDEYGQDEHDEDDYDQDDNDDEDDYRNLNRRSRHGGFGKIGMSRGRD